MIFTGIPACDHKGRWWKDLAICRTPLTARFQSSLWAGRDLSLLHCGLTLILPKLVSTPFLLQLFLPINFCTFQSSSYLFSGESNLWPLVSEVVQPRKRAVMCVYELVQSLPGWQWSTNSWWQSLQQSGRPTDKTLVGSKPGCVGRRKCNVSEMIQAFEMYVCGGKRWEI